MHLIWSIVTLDPKSYICHKARSNIARENHNAYSSYTLVVDGSPHAFLTFFIWFLATCQYFT